MTETVKCGCPDYGLSRRSMLKSAGWLSLAGITTSMIGDVLTSSVHGATNGNVLVVLSLRGGADGLSMVVPHAEPAYAKARPGTAIKTSSLLHADATFGLHPAFKPLSRWWSAGKLTALHAIGMPSPNRSHFNAMEVLEDADPGSAARVGWLNRVISALEQSPDAMHAMGLGSTIVPTSLVGPAPVVAAASLTDLRTPLQSGSTPQPEMTRMLRTTYANAGPVLAGPGSDAIELARRVSGMSAALNTPSRGTYSGASNAGRAMQLAAQTIRSGCGVRAIAIDIGGWDHHVGLTWNIQSRIHELATNLDGFFTDLGPDADRVTVVTLSEFGRRLQQNGSGGVDHGYGSCVLAMGAGVRGGRYYSRWPGLGAPQQVDGDLAVTTDYRSVLGEILANRFPDVNLSKIFPGVPMKPLGFMGPPQLIPGVL